MSEKKPFRVKKKNEYRLGYMYYVGQGKSLKEAAALIKVKEETLSNWADRGNWRETRNAKLLSTEKQEDIYKDILNYFAEETLELIKKLKTVEDDEKKNISIQLVGIADQAAKWNKVLERFKKDNKISLKVYLEVSEKIFDDLGDKYPNLYEQIIKVDFESEHILRAAQKLG